eukprot:1084845-Pleurochrysis_carterae.AAC.1
MLPGTAYFVEGVDLNDQRLIVDWRAIGKRRAWRRHGQCAGSLLFASSFLECAVLCDASFSLPLPLSVSSSLSPFLPPSLSFLSFLPFSPSLRFSNLKFKQGPIRFTRNDPATTFRQTCWIINPARQTRQRQEHRRTLRWERRQGLGCDEQPVYTES